MNQAENILTLLKKLGVYRAHFIAHDMGDSITTTLLTRFEKRVF